MRLWSFGFEDLLDSMPLGRPVGMRADVDVWTSSLRDAHLVVSGKVTGAVAAGPEQRCPHIVSDQILQPDRRCHGLGHRAVSPIVIRDTEHAVAAGQIDDADDRASDDPVIALSVTGPSSILLTHGPWSILHAPNYRVEQTVGPAIGRAGWAAAGAA